MPNLATLLPARRPELLIRPLGDQGQHVVKDPRTGEFFYLGEEEHFLLTQLDESRTAESICAAYAERFGAPLSEEELAEFVGAVRSQGFLLPEADTPLTPSGALAGGHRSILHWRKSLFDPDRFFTWLTPRIWFFWTRGFLVFSAGCIVTAVLVIWANGPEIAGGLVPALHWKTALLVWVTLLLVATLHEFAHGLTCKHHGGEVHEIGFLLLYLMPCFYCNVSEAWLFREKSKRLWVTFAGGYFELFLWALAVFVWRLTLPGSLVHHLAFVLLSVCGIQTLFNFNPLLKLDGYYLLSDWLEIPNLHQRALDLFKGRLRGLLWGAPQSEREPRGRLLLGFGLATWLYSLVFLGLMLAALFPLLRASLGWPGLAGLALLGVGTVRGMFQGFFLGEVSNMVRSRRMRTLGWVLVLGGLGAGCCLIEMEDWAAGSFQVRSASRAELRAPVAGFLREVRVDEGDRVSPGAWVARLEVPDLASRLARKQAEVREAQARLRLLEVGPRPEEIAEQRHRVERAKSWRDLAQQDVTRSRQILQEELDRLEKQIVACRAELDVARKGHERAKALLSQRALGQQQYQEAEGKHQASIAHWEQAQADKRIRQVKGTVAAEAEQARRDKELADAQASLNLLAAGSRPEEIDAERATLARLYEEARYLDQLAHSLLLCSPMAGVVTTPRLRERAGHYLKEGELICTLEDRGALEVEITLSEENTARVQPGQEVGLKARALPFESFTAQVDRKAPVAARGEQQSTVAIRCRLPDAPAELQPGMTGYARIYTGRRLVSVIALGRAMHFLRTEFWW